MPSIRKAKEIIGWEPKVDLDTALRKTFEYYLEQIKDRKTADCSFQARDEALDTRTSTFDPRPGHRPEGGRGYLPGHEAGRPGLLDLFKKHGVTASFFVPMGKDHTGRTVKRVFTRPGFLSKASRSGALKTYGLRTLLYGLLLPGPEIAKSHGQLLRQVVGQATRWASTASITFSGTTTSKALGPGKDRADTCRRLPARLQADIGRSRLFVCSAGLDDQSNMPSGSFKNMAFDTVPMSGGNSPSSPA